MQWVAIVWVLIVVFKVLLVDELIGNFDCKIGEDIMQILCILNWDQNFIIVMVIYDQNIVCQVDCTVQLVEG